MEAMPEELFHLLLIIVIMIGANIGLTLPLVIIKIVETKRRKDDW